MLDLGKEHDWFESALIVGLAVVAVIGFAAFLIWELIEKHPIVNLRVFRHRGFTAAVIVDRRRIRRHVRRQRAHAALAAELHGLHRTWAGLATAWTGVLAVFCAPVAGLLIDQGRSAQAGVLRADVAGGVLAIRTHRAPPT